MKLMAGGGRPQLIAGVSRTSSAMTYLDSNELDDPPFLTKISSVVTSSVQLYSPAYVHVVKIDGWFGPKWLGFSHKAHGAIGVTHQEDVKVVPPFVPNRVLSQRSWSIVGRVATPVQARAVHVRQSSATNPTRKLSEEYPDAALFWWTGASTSSKQGALMAYLPTPSGHVGWYGGMASAGFWRWQGVRGITIEGLKGLEAGDPTGHNPLPSPAG